MNNTVRHTNTPIWATAVLIKKLWENYILTTEDIVRANQVHLVCVWMLALDTEKHTYPHYVKSAIERLTIDHDIIHTDPYELRIDAWYFDNELNERDDILDEDKIFMECIKP